MLLPLGVSTYGKRSPWANLALIGLCVAVFVRMVRGNADATVETFALWTGRPAWYQFFTHLFLHADTLHLAGNMIFLWVFGNAVNGRLKHGAYLAFFMIAGAIAAAAQLRALGQDERGLPMVGASGAIMGVAGLCMVLFPLNPARVVFLLVVWPLRFQVKTLWLVLLFAALDLANLLRSGDPRIAYTAHLAGFAVGVAAGLVLLKMGWVERDGYDLLAWLGRRGRFNPDPIRIPTAVRTPVGRSPADPWGRAR